MRTSTDCIGGWVGPRAGLVQLLLLPLVLLLLLFKFVVMDLVSKLSLNAKNGKTGQARLTLPSEQQTSVTVFNVRPLAILVHICTLLHVSFITDHTQSGRPQTAVCLTEGYS
jgi:hypothetical protein